MGNLVSGPAGKYKVVGFDEELAPAAVGEDTTTAGKKPKRMPIIGPNGIDLGVDSLRAGADALNLELQLDLEGSFSSSPAVFVGETSKRITGKTVQIQAIL